MRNIHLGRSVCLLAAFGLAALCGVTGGAQAEEPAAKSKAEAGLEATNRLAEKRCKEQPERCEEIKKSLEELRQSCIKNPEACWLKMKKIEQQRAEALKRKQEVLLKLRKALEEKKAAQMKNEPRKVGTVPTFPNSE